MPVKMIALRVYYSTDDSKQYQAGDSFTVPSDREADRLERMRKAKRAGTQPTPRATQPAPSRATRAKVMTAEPEAAAPVVAAAPAEPASDPAPETPTIEPAGNRYRRNDMRAED